MMARARDHDGARTVSLLSLVAVTSSEILKAKQKLGVTGIFFAQKAKDL